MRWCVQSDEQNVLFGAERGCDEFEQRVLRFDGARSDAPRADDEVLYVLAGAARATIDGEARELDPGTAVFVAAGTTLERRRGGRPRDAVRARRAIRFPPTAPHAVVDSTRSSGRRDRRARSSAARSTPERLRVGDAVRRLHPARPRARPLPPLRRGRLRARGRGRAAHRRRVRAAAARLVHPSAGAARPLRSRTSGRARCRCSASSGRRARRPRRTTPTAPRPSSQ